MIHLKFIYFKYLSLNHSRECDICIDFNFDQYCFLQQLPLKNCFKMRSFCRWKEVSVHIGHVTHPTRIRIECHSKGNTAVAASKGNTECYIDNIEMVKCDGELFCIYFQKMKIQI